MFWMLVVHETKGSWECLQCAVRNTVLTLTSDPVMTSACLLSRCATSQCDPSW